MATAKAQRPWWSELDEEDEEEQDEKKDEEDK